jgi:hypothetical protein
MAETAEGMSPPQAGAGGGGSLINSETAGRLLMISSERVRQLVKEGWIIKLQKDQYRLVDVVQGYIRFRDSADRRAQRSAAENRVRDARAREIEMRTALRTHELCETEEAIAAMESVVGMVRSEFGGTAARFTRDLTERRRLDNEINACLNRVAARCGTEAKALRSGALPPITPEAAVLETEDARL